MLELKTVDGIVAEMRQCFSCGSGFASYGPSDGECSSCRQEREAREKPQFLRDMEAVSEGAPPQTDFQRAMKMMMERKPQDFITQMRAAQREYATKLEALAEIEKARRPAPIETPDSIEVDEGTERLEELIERLLKEAGA